VQQEQRLLRGKCAFWFVPQIIVLLTIPRPLPEKSCRLLPRALGIRFGHHWALHRAGGGHPLARYQGGPRGKRHRGSDHSRARHQQPRGSCKSSRGEDIRHISWPERASHWYAPILCPIRFLSIPRSQHGGYPP
jgi:hypothetical protein